ncbi:MAG: ABC transporter substrate-binding protein [Candidatus Roseilinea sp.]|uniref:ABC transporter substrate-binding protein n=1 Tax=Candidatus Roseilinea sp. TaxID=2838777 RepID=UPI00404A5160
MSRKVGLALAFCCALAIIIPAVVSRLRVAQTADAQWDELRARGALRVAVDAGWWPFSFFDEVGWQGLDAELTREIARRLQLAVQPDPVGYDALYDALHLKRSDIAVSAVVVDPARTATIAYSAAYFDAGVHMVVFGNPAIRRPQDLEGRRVAVALGSDADRVARYWERRLANLRRVTTEDEADAVSAARAGRVDAALVEAWTALRETRGLADDEVVLISVEPRLYAIAMRSDNMRLLAAVNEALSEMRADGTLRQLIDRWVAADR